MESNTTKIAFYYFPRWSRFIFLSVLILFILALFSSTLDIDILLSIYGVFIFIRVILPLLLSSKIIEFDPNGIRVTYYIPLRKKWSESYENLIGYTTHENLVGPRDMGRSQDIILSLKNGRFLRVAEYSPSHKIPELTAFLDAHGIERLSDGGTMPKFRYDNPYL